MVQSPKSPGRPAFDQQGLLLALNRNVDELQRRQDQLEKRQVAMYGYHPIHQYSTYFDLCSRYHNLFASQKNSTISQSGEVFVVLYSLKTGEFIPNFPADSYHLQVLDMVHVNRILGELLVPCQDLDDAKKRLTLRTRIGLIHWPV